MYIQEEVFINSVIIQLSKLVTLRMKRMLLVIMLGQQVETNTIPHKSEHVFPFIIGS
jgi:hypothetical protein